MAKLKISRILAIFLAFVMLFSMIPGSVFTTVFAVELDSYSVQLTDGTDVIALDGAAITLTNKADESKTATVKTVGGIAVFENFVEEEATYVVSVAKIIGYQIVEATEITVAAGETSTNIVLTELEKVTISGVVTDDQGKPYEGATVAVKGYTELVTVTDAEGKYTFTVYADQQNVIQITAKAEDVQYQAIPCTATYGADEENVNYQFALKTFEIDTKAGENGTITADVKDVPYGKTQQISIKADTGYRIKEIKVDGTPVADVENKTEYTVSLENIQSNHTVEATFYKATYTVSFEVSNNGQVSYQDGQNAPGGKVTNVNVDEGGDLEFKAEANDGYHVEKVDVAGNVLLSDGTNANKTYTGTVSAAEINTVVKVTVTFSINEYAVNLTKNDGGKVEIDSTDPVPHGGARVISIKADTGYRIKEIKIDGVSQPDVKDKQEYEIRLTDIQYNRSVEVEFYKATYTVSFEVSNDGKVTYNTDKTAMGGQVTNVSVNEGGSLEFLASANLGFHVENVKIGDDVKLADGTNADNTYSGTVGPVGINTTVTVSVTFSINEYKVTVGQLTNGAAAVVDKDNAETNTIKHGESAKITITPNEGFAISSVTVNGADAAFTAEGNGFVVLVENITADQAVEIAFAEPEKVTAEDKLANEFYQITFDKEVKKDYWDGDTRVIVLPKDGKATITPVAPYMGIKYNENNANGEYFETITIEETVEITNILVKETDFASSKKNVAVNVKIIIDKSAPALKEEIAQPDWTSSETVEITGSFKDEGGSGLQYVVWSWEKKLSVDEALRETTNRADVKQDGTFAFFSESGTQNCTYYVYAIDYAGNVSEVVEVGVKIDRVAPTVTGFVFSADENDLVQDMINFLSFGTLCKQTMYLKVVVTDGDISSGLKSVTLYCNGIAKETKDVAFDGDNYYAIFQLTEEEFEIKQSISAVVTDKVGNESEETQPTEIKQGMIQSDYVQITDAKPNVTITPVNAVYTYADAQGNTHYWYNGHAQLDITVVEEIAGLQSVEIEINGKVIEKDLDGKDLMQNFALGEALVTNLTFRVGTEQNPLGETIDGVYTIVVRAISATGERSLEYTQVVYIDTTPATVVEYKIETVNDDAISKVVNFLTFGIFCNEEVKITVTAADGTGTAGVKEITLFLDNAAYETKAAENNQATFYIPVAELSKSDYTNMTAVLSATATDNVGNTTVERVRPSKVNADIQNDTLMLENIAPVLSDLKSEPLQNVREDENAYSGDAKITFAVQDDESGLRSVTVQMNGADYPVTPAAFTEQDKNKHTYTLSTENLQPDKNGQYKFEITVVDNAGNETKEEIVVEKDLTAPYISGFDFKIGDSSNKQDVVSAEIYGYYFKEAVTVTVNAVDPVIEEELRSGVSKITVMLKDVNGTYYTVDANNKIVESTEAVAHEAVKTEDGKGTFTFTVDKDFKGQIYAFATDRVGNMPTNNSFKATDTEFIKIVADGLLKGYQYPAGSILETQGKHDAAEYDHIVFEKAETAFKTNDAENNDLYADNVEVKLTVTDNYSGIAMIEWSVIAPYDVSNNQSGRVIVANNDKTAVDSTIAESGWKVVARENNLVTQLQKTITVNNDSNNIVVWVKLTDRAGNVTEDEIQFNIDKQAPIITVEMNDNDDETYAGFFGVKRDYTVTILERNFLNNNVKFAVTVKDANDEPKILPDFKPDMDGDQPQSTVIDGIEYYTYKWSGDFKMDGDYTFAVSAIDLAGYETADEAVSYVNADGASIREISNTFTIDLIAPEVTVSYNDIPAMNGNYFNADRIATIVVKEHNFEPTLVEILGTATDNGVQTDFPVISQWTVSGKDTYKTQIAYTADAKYSFDIAICDKANNSIADYNPDVFYVDKTAPNLAITGVADKSANNGVVAPVITYSDTNFNKNAVTITLNGVNNGTNLVYAGSYEDVANGQIFTYENFEEIQSVDDIYTLTVKLIDMAGNETEVSITFSANRFGSVYDLSRLEGLLTEYLQTEQDVIFTETNVDALERNGIKITLTKNGTPSDLVEGTDYTVTLNGGDGQWSVYTYTIKKALFADDGRYSIAIYSKDAAGNINENIDESKKAEISFGIDKTKPVIVPIDLESGVQYAVDGKTVSVEIKDNLVLEGVKIYLNGQEVEYTVNGETYTFDVPKSNSKQNVKIVAIDAAGNEEPVEIADFLVNANIFVRWYNNTPLFVGSIIGVVVLALGITAFIVFGKKKKEAK